MPTSPSSDTATTPERFGAFLASAPDPVLVCRHDDAAGLPAGDAR